MTKDIEVKYTVKEMLNEIKDSIKLLDEKIDAVHSQTQITNGRVTRLERNSIGQWISNHKLQAALVFMSFTAFLVSDSRNFIIETIKLLG